MLSLSSSLIGVPVVSLRTGTAIAEANDFLINPDNLKIEGFYCADRLSNNQLILLEQDIRDFTRRGYIVNDHDVLVEAEDLVRLKQVIELSFSLNNKSVITVNGKKLGKVSDFAAETTTYYIQKIYVSQPILKSITGGNLSIDRSFIHEVNHKEIIVQDIFNTEKARAPAALSV